MAATSPLSPLLAPRAASNLTAVAGVKWWEDVHHVRGKPLTPQNNRERYEALFEAAARAERERRRAEAEEAARYSWEAIDGLTKELDG